jgi:resuscitation-promoting factor RpfB
MATQKKPRTSKSRIGRFKFHQFKNHPFIVPVTTFLLLFIITLAGYINFNGYTVGPSDSNLVHINIDGKEQTIPTRAATVRDLLVRLDIKVDEHDVVTPSLDTEIFEDNLKIKVRHARPVLIVDGEKKTVAYTANKRPRDVAKKAGIAIYPEDYVEARPLDPIKPTEALQQGIAAEQIVIDRATPAHLNLYGTALTIRTRAKTVGQLLDEKKVKIAEGDTITPSRETALAPDTQIFVVRIGKQIITEEETIPAPVQTLDDPTMLDGKIVVREAGADGKKVTTYELELRNDKEVSRRPIQEILVSRPVLRVVVRGTKVIISNPSENVKLGERLAAERGWTGSQWTCLYQLWQKESKWNHLARNRSSGAYGIPQALPGSKMAIAGADWETNPATQIIWGLDFYIVRRYGSPCGAWQHSQAVGWY